MPDEEPEEDWLDRLNRETCGRLGAKRCPFCGGPPRIRGSGFWSIGCRSCNAVGPLRSELTHVASPIHSIADAGRRAVDVHSGLQRPARLPRPHTIAKAPAVDAEYRAVHDTPLVSRVWLVVLFTHATIPTHSIAISRRSRGLFPQEFGLPYHCLPFPSWPRLPSRRIIRISLCYQGISGPAQAGAALGLKRIRNQTAPT
jgi:hypothetical protein